MPEPPILLAKWYDYAKWIIERVDSFPKNQRFIFGQRLAGHADVAQASGLPYRSASSLPPGSQRERCDHRGASGTHAIRQAGTPALRAVAPFCMAKDQMIFTARQYEFSCERLEECGRMTGGWLKQAARKV
jgi:hypothetical protein